MILCILRWLRRRVGERLGELRALLGELRARRPKSVLGERFRRLAGGDARRHPEGTLFLGFLLALLVLVAVLGAPCRRSLGDAVLLPDEEM